MEQDPLANEFIQQIPRLRRYARALTADRESAEDLVQDCLERAWERQAQWRKGSDLRAWMFSIMHNLYVNKVRSESRQVAYLRQQDPDDLPSWRNTGAMDLHDLERGIADLPSDQREVLLLVCLEDLSYQEVCEILDIPIGTVMSRLHRARERLRRWMAREQRPSLRSVK